jgi:hypothetical protein
MPERIGVAKRKASTKPLPTGSQRALVIGVSKYPDPAHHLPGVAADVREMAKVLSSKNGTFRSSGVTILTDKEATRNSVLAALRKVFTEAGADETLFVYLAGHGAVVGGDYFFIAYDTDGSRLNETGVSLKEIKALFDQTKSRRAFLWLDFCHSGGILARGATDSDMSAIQRAIGVVSGHGKVIVAACTPTQYAYEDPSVGHGLFTHALLRGLRGEAKSAQGEVTALSLYEHIDHHVGSPRQQPVLFGELTGRIVLMHFPDRKKSPKTTTPAKTSAKKKAGAKKVSDWVMLGDNFFRANSVRHRSEGTIELAISPTDSEEEAALSSLRPTQYGGTTDLPFAVNNDAHSVRVEQVETETASGRQVWNVTLKVLEENFGGGFATEMTYNTGDKTYTPDDIAKLRAGRLLLNDPAPIAGRKRGFSDETLLDGMIEGSGSRHSVKECVVGSVYASHGKNANWKEFARLRAVFLLKATGTIEHVLELKIGATRNGKVSVSFRGRRPQQYSDVQPETIEVKGSCPLS